MKSFSGRVVYPTPSQWTGNTTASVSRLGNTAGKNIGPNVLQKVMAGDNVSASVQYYYQSSSGNSNPGFVSNLLSSLVQGIVGGNAATNLVKGQATNISSQLGGNPAFVTAVTPSGSGGTTPQAYLTILFFDERFNFISASDGGVSQQQVATSVTSAGAPLGTLTIKAPKNGYVFVYVSNSSDQDVYFDNLNVAITASNIIEENHYYAFGLKIAAISSNKIGDTYEGTLDNKYKMQGAFAEMDDDIGWNDFELRNYDPQIGRWMQQDPFQEFASPYSGMANDPINNIDPTGGIVPIGGLSTTADKAITLGEVVVTASIRVGTVSHAVSPILTIAKIALQIAMIGINIIDKSVTTSQTGNIRITTDVGDYPLYNNQDAAAFGWATLFSGYGKKGDIEYSGEIYSVNYKGKQYYGFTRAVRFPDNPDNDPDKPTPHIQSPGPYDELHKSTLPPSATIIGQIHIHYAENDEAINNDFSQGNYKSSGDHGIIADNPDLTFYLLNNIGELRVHRPASNQGAPYSQTIAVNIYEWKNVELNGKNIGKRPLPKFGVMIGVNKLEDAKQVGKIDPITGKIYLDK